jgi:hypothetical protein
MRPPGSPDVIKEVAELGNELAQAEQERQRTAQALIGAARDAGAYLGPHFRNAVSEFAGLCGDQMAYWRFSNFNRLLNKVEAKIKDGKVPPHALRKLSFADSVRVIEAASAEEEDSVQELWARLIKNAVDPAGTTTVKKVYIELLKSLSPPEAAFLDLLSKGQLTKRLTVKEAQTLYAEMHSVADQCWRLFDNDEQKVAIQNLTRLRCITFKPERLDARDLLVAMPSVGRSPGRQAAVDPFKFQRLLGQLVDMISMSAGIADPRYERVTPAHRRSGEGKGRISAGPEMNFILTPLGRGLMHACRKDEGVEQA